jgi:2-polyprenyl-3-methyl-5-hydroxy-6-metoxy-1,4-benzoquinol methylase
MTGKYSDWRNTGDRDHGAAGAQSDETREGPERKGDLSSIYEVPVDPFAENNSHAFALSFVGYNKSVLEVGCSTGYLTKIMSERGCEVVGIELDPEAAEIAEKWAERVVVGNIDEGHVWDEVKDESFDVVLLGDVLEHLRDPLTSLRQAVKKLKPSGYVVTSIPNIAHGDVRLALMQGRFTYRETGLLDRTHIHFFTLETARELLAQAGLVVVNTKRVVMPLFMSELGITREGVSHATLDELHADPEVESYQFVMKAVRDSGDLAVAELANQVTELTDRVHHQRMRIALLRKGIRDSKVMDGYLREHQRYIEALQGHVSGLEHNIELLEKELQAADARYRAALAPSTKPSRSRRVYDKLVRTFKPNSPESHG